MSKYKELNITNIKKYSLRKRESKVHIEQFAKPLQTGKEFQKFLDSIPDILSGKEFKDFIELYLDALQSKSPVIFMMGAHVLKVGLNNLLIDALKTGWISHLAMNGACVIHDVELAMIGQTSEDVAKGIQDGSFGMAEETARFINSAVSQGKGKYGYAESVAVQLSKSGFRFLSSSVIYNAYILNVPITAHPALGTEIIHQHDNVDGAAIGETSYRDFKIFGHTVSQLNPKSIVLNIGSAVIMPEIFLKALTVVRNLGYNAFGFTTANFDMQKHYRPDVNVVKRPTQNNGKGFHFIGHHEIMLPLLFASIKSKLIS